MNRRKVLAVASGGGHWVQLLRVRPAFADQQLVFVTVDPVYQSQVPGYEFHVVNDATRWSKLSLFRLALRMAWIVIRERPDIVISTGAAPGYFALMFGKLAGARTIWLDSIANAEKLSRAGQRVRRFADLYLTQWPHLSSADGPTYCGAVL